MTAPITCIEEYKASKLEPVRFHTIAHVDRRIVIDLVGSFTIAAAKLYVAHLQEQIAAAECEAQR